MIYFTHIRVRTFVVNELHISWEFEIDPDDRVQDYVFTVLRSEAPHDGFEVASPPLVNVFEYFDRDAITESKWRKFYYKVSVKHSPSGRVFDSDLASSSIPLDASLEALEMVSRNNMLLYGAGGDYNKRFIGTACWVFIKKTFGPRCACCYDHRLKQTIKDSCEDCFGTGREGGYFAPIRAVFSIGHPGQTVDHANIGMQEPAKNQAWTSNYPLLKPGDIVVEPGNKRWDIESMTPTGMGGIVVRQMVALHYMSPSSIEYKLVVPGDP